MVSVLTNFVDSVGDFLTGIKTGISNAIQKLPKLDLGQLRRQNEDSLDSANDNLNKVRRDMISTVGVYNDPTNAGLESYDEDQPLIFDEFGGDEKKDEKKDENKTEDPTKDKVEGVGDDKNLKSYEKNKILGGFILVDRFTNKTVAAGLINFSLRRADNIFEQSLTINKNQNEICKQIIKHKPKYFVISNYDIFKRIKRFLYL